MVQEVIAGSDIERKTVEKLKRKLSENADWTDFMKTPVTTWKPIECTLTVGDLEVNCIPLPYTIEAEVEDYLTSSNSASMKPGGILVSEYPENYYSTGVKILDAYEKGASAVILLEKDGLTTRKVVITNPPYVAGNRGLPPPIPIVTLDSRDGLRLVKYLETDQARRARLLVKAEVKSSFGYSVIAGFNGRGEGEIHVSSHHDHWFEGVGDSLVGLKTLERLTSLLSKTRERPNVILISFTAKELGSPSLKPYPWSWGSNYFLEVMNNKSRLENVVFSINIDAVHQPEPIVYYHPSLRKLLIESLPPGWEAVSGGNHYSFDSLSYLKKGIPTILVTTLQRMFSWEIHYSSLDNFENVQVDPIVDSISNFVLRTIMHANPSEIGAQGLFEYLIRDDLSSEYRSLVVKTLQARRLIGDRETMRILTKALTECAALRINEQIHYYAGLGSTVVLVKQVEKIIEKFAEKEGSAYRIMLQRSDGGLYDFLLTDFNKSFAETLLHGVFEDAVGKYEEAFKLDYTFKVLSKFHRIQGDFDGKGEPGRIR